MTNLISQAFKNDKKKLVTFVTGGDPDFDTSLQIINTIINNGADIMEIGMPTAQPSAPAETKSAPVETPAPAPKAEATPQPAMAEATSTPATGGSNDAADILAMIRSRKSD